jgi:hypothetical protein
LFIFKGADTAFAYYDAAVGTHLELAIAVDRALEVASRLIGERRIRCIPQILDYDEQECVE